MFRTTIIGIAAALTTITSLSDMAAATTTTRTTGFDCSELVQWAAQAPGRWQRLRVTEQQLASGNEPRFRKGYFVADVTYENARGDVHHVAISIGDGRSVGASRTCR